MWFSALRYFLRAKTGTHYHANSALNVNGKIVECADNVLIGDQDKLLISYGTSESDFGSRYNKIENKAKTVDETSDPSTCSGLNGSHDTSARSRLKDAFSFTR